MLSGNNGILQKATQSKEKTERAKIIENAQMDILAKITDKKGENITEHELVEILTSSNYNTQGRLSSEESVLDRTLTSKNGKFTIPVSEIYNGVIKESERIKTALDLKEGDRILYNSSVGDIECIVLYDSNEENYLNLGIQIVSTNVVEKNIEIGNGTGSSEESSNENLFNIAVNSYNEAISMLNTKAETYLKTNGQASDARCIGSLPTNKNSQSTKQTYREDSLLGDGVYSWNGPDDNFNMDYSKLQELGSLITDEEYWLASRFRGHGMVSQWYGLRWVNMSGTGSDLSVLYWDTTYGDHSSKSYKFGLRPVFTLFSDSKLKEGEGTIASPYILE